MAPERAAMRAELLTLAVGLIERERERARERQPKAFENLPISTYTHYLHEIHSTPRNMFEDAARLCRPSFPVSDWSRWILQAGLAEEADRAEGQKEGPGAAQCLA